MMDNTPNSFFGSSAHKELDRLIDLFRPGTLASERMKIYIVSLNFARWHQELVNSGKSFEDNTTS